MRERRNGDVTPKLSELKALGWAGPGWAGHERELLGP